MREIGSEFWTRCTPSSMQYYSMRPQGIYNKYSIKETLSGRTGLEYFVELLRFQGAKRAYLPSYCCHTMVEPFISHGLDIYYYDVQVIENGFHRVINQGEYDAILLMDYFGYIDLETIEIAFREKERGRLVIYDVTHTMYSEINTEPYDYIFGSYRKWVDINCGFLAWKGNLSKGFKFKNYNSQAFASIRKELFDKKALYMQDGSVKKEEFLPLIEQAERILEEQYHHKTPDKRSREVLKFIDASYIKSRRRGNAKVLTEAINEINDERVRCISPAINPSDVPLFVPVIVAPSIRNALRKYLIDHQIYCPVHWPLSDMHKLMTGSKQLFESELSLICDQRYGADDMCRIAETIRGFLMS